MIHLTEIVPFTSLCSIVKDPKTKILEKKYILECFFFLLFLGGKNTKNH